MTSHAPNHVTTTTAGTDHGPFITDAAREDPSTGQGHTTDLTAAEAPATIRGMHPTPHPTITAAHDTHSLKDALGNTFAGTHCTDTATTHLQHCTLHARVTLVTTLQTKASLI